MSFLFQFLGYVRFLEVNFPPSHFWISPFFLKFSFLVTLKIYAGWTCVFWFIQGASTSERSCFKLPSPYRVFSRRPTDAGETWRAAKHDSPGWYWLYQQNVSMLHMIISAPLNIYIIMSLFHLGFFKWYSLLPNTIPDHTPNSWLLKLKRDWFEFTVVGQLSPISQGISTQKQKCRSQRGRVGRATWNPLKVDATLQLHYRLQEALIVWDWWKPHLVFWIRL